MKFCSHCGKEIMDAAVICPHCGCTTNGNTIDNIVTEPNDAPNMGFAILGFLIPLAGLIIYLVCKDKTPLKAGSAGKGAIVGFITNIVLVVLYSVLLGSLFSDLLYLL